MNRHSISGNNTEQVLQSQITDLKDDLVVTGSNLSVGGDWLAKTHNQHTSMHPSLGQELQQQIWSHTRAPAQQVLEVGSLQDLWLPNPAGWSSAAANLLNNALAASTWKESNAPHLRKRWRDWQLWSKVAGLTMWPIQGSLQPLQWPGLVLGEMEYH